MAFSDRQQRALDAVDAMQPDMSTFHQEIFSYAEPAWREYRSAAAYVRMLRDEGFEPGYSQETVPYRKPREEFHPWAPGFTDAHSALGVGAATGAIALKRALECSGGGGRIRLFGEPAEKVCGSKAVHAAKGYYDDLDFAIAYHPLVQNAANGELQGCLYWGVVFTFECTDATPWLDSDPLEGSGLSAHNSVRSPGAVDALGLMLTAVKYSKENMFPRTGLWSLNEVVLGAGNATADNLAPRVTQIQFSWRSPLMGIQEQILSILKRCAKHVGGLSNTEVSMRWVTRIRPGLANMVLSHLVHETLTDVGVPTWGEEAYDFARQLEQSIGGEPSQDPFRESLYRIVTPEERDIAARKTLPPWQDCTGADDYSEYTWHTPTVRFYTAKPLLKAAGEDMFHWANNAMNGLAAAIDPTWVYAGKVIAVAALALLDDPELLGSARAEFHQRRAAGPVEYRTPLLPADFEPPIDLPWPEYHTTARGYEWVLPTTSNVGERIS